MEIFGSNKEKAPFAMVAIILYFFVAETQAQGFAWFSCEERSRFLSIADAIITLTPDLLITQADTPYTNKSWINTWGATTGAVQFDSLASGPNLKNFNHQYDQMMANLGWQQLMAGRYDIYSQFDDHEWGGDNYFKVYQCKCWKRRNTLVT